MVPTKDAMYVDQISIHANKLKSTTMMRQMPWDGCGGSMLRGWGMGESTRQDSPLADALQDSFACLDIHVTPSPSPS
jgi:hypothetical protein